MICRLFQNQASTSGTLPSNTIPNPKGEMKAITTRSGVAYEGPSIPTNPSPKKVVEQETEETTDKEQSNVQGSTAQIPPPVTPIPISEPDVPKTLPKTTSILKPDTSDSLLEEFADELALLDLFPSGNEDFDFEADLREIELLLNRDPSTDFSPTITIDHNPERFINEPALVCLPPPGDDDDDKGCDLPFCNNKMIFSNPLFSFNDAFTSSDDESFLKEDILEDVESKDSNVSNFYEPVLLNTPLFDEDECFDPGGEIDKIDAFMAAYNDSCDNHDLSRVMAWRELRGHRDIYYMVNYYPEVFVKLLLDSFGNLESISNLNDAMSYTLPIGSYKLRALCMSPPIRIKYHDFVAFAIGCKRIKNSKRCNRKIRIPFAMWPCRVEEKMTLKEVDGQTVKEIKTKIIAKDGTITRVPGKFQGYETSKEEPFAPHRLPQPKGNMNGWLIEDEEEVKRNEVDSDLESTASSKPIVTQVTNNVNNANNGNGGNGGGGNGNGRNNGCTFKAFQSCNPKEYDGKGGAIVLTRWIEKMENVIDNSGCAENQKVRYAASSLVNKALTWWNTQVQARGREAAMAMTWNDFKALMVEEFCPSNEMEKLENEF
ncbi:hypothetical protein Tco_0451400 [Tanacetum coccineum]